MTIDVKDPREEEAIKLVREKRLALLPEKFRKVIDDLVASGADLDSVIKTDNRAKAIPETEVADGNIRVEIPGSLDLTKYGITGVEDIPSAVSVRGDLTIDGKMFFELDGRDINIDGDLVVRNFKHAMPIDTSKSLAEQLTQKFYEFDKVSLAGTVRLENSN